MKNFIKKYPKRIFITALVILLIAVIGTVNNYRTYRGDTGDTVRPAPFRYLESIYGKGNVLYGKDIPYYSEGVASGVFCKTEQGEYIYLGKRINHVYTMKTDKDKYSWNDTVVATLENYGVDSTEFDSEYYVLEVYRDGRWYAVHTGLIGEDLGGETVKLVDGESWTFSVKLDEVREMSDEPIKLKRGKYRLGKQVTLKNRISEPGSKEINAVENAWAACEFEIK